MWNGGSPVVGSHLVAEAIRLGARLICPLDEALMDKQGTKDPDRWGHLNQGMNEWHVMDAPKGERE